MSFKENLIILEQFVAHAQKQIPTILSIILTIWVVNLVNFIVLKRRLNLFGIIPRTTIGLPGILLSPILHGNFNHLFFNSIPLFVLSIYLLTLSQFLFISATAIITLLGGSLVWLLGRKYIHIGASGVITGYFSFSLGLAYVEPNIATIFIAIILLYYFASILLGLLPLEEGASWEGHVFGFISGIVAVYLCVFNVTTKEWLLDIYQFVN